MGEGEKSSSLRNLSHKLKLSEFIHFLGYKENIYSYLKKADCFILSSLWEDPGFVLIESAFLNIPIISSDCHNGPKEIINNNERGYLFENDNINSLVKTYSEFRNSEKNLVRKKIQRAKVYSKNYTIFAHYLKLSKILNLKN